MAVLCQSTGLVLQTAGSNQENTNWKLRFFEKSLEETREEETLIVSRCLLFISSGGCVGRDQLARLEQTFHSLAGAGRHPLFLRSFQVFPGRFFVAEQREGSGSIEQQRGLRMLGPDSPLQFCQRTLCVSLEVCFESFESAGAAKQPGTAKPQLVQVLIDQFQGGAKLASVDHGF